MAKCRFCKKEIKDTNNCYVVSGDHRNTYYCDINCYHNQQAKSKYKPNKKTPEGNNNPRRELTDYIMSIYVNQGYDKHDIPWQMLMSQLSNMLNAHKDENYNYSSVLYVLKYMNEILGVNLFDTRSNGSVLSLVEYYYQEARKYCTNTLEIQKEIENFEFDNKPICVKNTHKKDNKKYKELNFD